MLRRPQMEPRSQVTQILGDWNRGDKDAADRLFPLVYEELKRIAARYFGRERKDHTLQPTALVHEAFLRLVDQTRVKWESRAHFMAVAATMMRRILVDYARAHEAQRRGGEWQRVLLEDALIYTDGPVIDYLALETALVALAHLDARQARIVEMRFFGGMTVDEIAELEHVSAPTVKRYWSSAKAFLQRELSREAPSDTGTLEPGS